MHIGSGVDYQHLERVCDAMVQQVIDLGHDISAISAGGGLSIPYQYGEEAIDTEHYFGLWNSARERIAAHLGHPVSLEIEPGRFLMAEAGVLVAEVRAVKDMGSRHFVLVDAGFNDLMRPAMYGSYHHISLLPADGRNTEHQPLRIYRDCRAVVRIRRRVHPTGRWRHRNPRVAAGAGRRLSGIP